MKHAEIQRALIARGYDLGNGGPSGKGDDGIWGDMTTNAVVAFQKANGLLGDLGDRTLAALKTEPATKPAVGVVPADWMPNAKMQRVIAHWTAGGHKASATDKDHYHILIEADAKLVRGKPSIDLNAAPIKAGSGYAAHTLNCNSGSIGVSLCCMAGAVENPFKAGSAPMTREQWEMLPRVVADLCRRYGIAVTPKTVLSHAEVQSNLGIAQRGKWDIARLAFDPSVVGAKACGDQLRAAVAALI